MLNMHEETFFECAVPYEEAEIALFGAPFDSTSSFRPGARFASRAMRGDSFGLESYSPYQDKDLTDIRYCDAGELLLPFGNTGEALGIIEKQTEAFLNDRKLPLMIGGEHLVTLGAVRAVLARYPDLHILQLDAHADLRETYLGEHLSHATVLRRCWDLVGDGRIHQFGIRSGDREEFLWAKGHTHLHKFDFTALPATIAALAGKPIYLTLDLDILDPGDFPGTGTPEAGGVDFPQLLSALLAISSLPIVACDICELAPVYDQSGASTAIALKVLRELLLALGDKSPK